jgi:hypothetical protein
VQDLLQHRILVPYRQIKYAFRLFLVAKPSGEARPVLDMSPWTTFYDPPPIHIYSAAEVSSTIPPRATMIKIDLQSGFFQIPICQQYWQYYGVHYEHQRYAWTRLPMGHPLAPALMQRVETTVAQNLHSRFDVTKVSYLDDWLIFSQSPLPVQELLTAIQALGLTINEDKSVLHPITAMTYLGLLIDTT